MKTFDKFKPSNSLDNLQLMVLISVLHNDNSSKLGGNLSIVSISQL